MMFSVLYCRQSCSINCEMADVSEQYETSEQGTSFFYYLNTYLHYCFIVQIIFMSMHFSRYC